MKVLVVFGTRLGSTAEIAERIARRFRQAGVEATVSSAREAGGVLDYDGIVIGSGVYDGHWLKEAREFISTNQAALAERPVWLFSSGPVGSLATRHAAADPWDLRWIESAISPRGHRTFAGAMDRSRLDDSELGFAQRLVARRFVPEGDFRDWPAIESWADAIAGEVAGAPVAGADGTSIRMERPTAATR